MTTRSLPSRRPSRSRGRSLQAAARQLPPDDGRRSPEEPWSLGGFAWQSRAWHVYRHLGIIHYAMSFIRDNASLLGFYAAEVSDDPESEPEPLDLDHPAAVEVQRLGNGPYGGVENLVAELVVHDKVAGEGYLAVRYERDGDPVPGDITDPPADAVEVWEVLTAQTRAMRKRNPTLAPAQDVRFWRPDPERPEWPDSSLRAVLPECEQLLLIQQMTTGTLQSRLHNGALLVPDELDPSPPGPPGEGDDTMSPLMADIFRVLSSPISDPSAAAAIMPYILFGKSDLLSDIRHISFARDFDSMLLEIKTDLVRTIASGIDLPAERLLGMGDVNHWGQWLLDEITYSQHLAPAVDLVVQGLVRAWLRPAWRAAGLDPDRFTLFTDSTELTSRVRKGDDAIAAYKLGELSGSGLRTELGFDDSYAPTASDPGLRGQVAPQDTELRAGPGNVVTGPPLVAAGTPGLDGTTLSDIDAATLTALATLADAQVGEVLADGRDRLSAQLEASGVDPERIGFSEAIRMAGITPESVIPDDSLDSLVPEATAIFAVAQLRAREEVEKMAQVAGGMPPIPDPVADETARTAAAVGLAASLIAWVRGQLFTPTPGPDPGAVSLARGETGAFNVPPGLILDSMTVAGGGRGATPGSVGVANGGTVEDLLAQTGISTVAWRWDYGTLPRNTFRPHQRLSGTIFDDFEASALYNEASRWPHNLYWYPGDHRGCACRATRVLALASEVQT